MVKNDDFEKVLLVPDVGGGDDSRNIDEEEVLLFLRPIQIGNEVHFKCNLCGKCASNKSNMRKHMLVMHTKPTNRPCPYCPKMFRNKYYLRYHVKICSYNPEVVAKRGQPNCSSSFL